MIFRHIVIVLAIISLISCSDGPEVNNYDLVIRNGAKYLIDSTEPFTGIGIVERDANGRRLKIAYKNGVMHGSSYTYFPDGTIQFESVFEKGIQTFSTTWYKSGARSGHMKYTGINSGLEERWHPNGKRATIATIQNNQIVPGSVTYWDKDGNELK